MSGVEKKDSWTGRLVGPVNRIYMEIIKGWEGHMAGHKKEKEVGGGRKVHGGQSIHSNPQPSRRIWHSD